MNTQLSIEEQIALLMTEREIKKVILDYCSLQDKRQLDAFIDLFTDDCDFRYPGLEIKGKKTLKEFYIDEIFTHNEFCYHACHNIDIEVGRDTANAEAYYGVQTLWEGDPQEAYGRYLFKFVKDAEKWKISEFDCTFFLWNGSLAPEDPSELERFWFNDEIKAKFQKGS